jgi:quercetin dioxygenase-like cupin family protein
MSTNQPAETDPAHGWRTLKNRHNGEVLSMRRVIRDGVLQLELKGTLPPRKPGPPLHIHTMEDETGVVTAGTLSAELNGRVVRCGPGERVAFPKGSAHRWWNDGDDVLGFEGFASPVVDLDVFFAGIFEVLNSGPANRPPVFHMAHLVWRHRKTQILLVGPRWVQAVLVPLVVVIGTLLGKYRGTSWPGCPARVAPAPLVESAFRARA